MELELDKEIDILLRNSRGGRGVLVGDSLNRHLDVDEASAFAENALPVKARHLYTLHLADCDYCRESLSRLITANADSRVPEAPVAASPIEAVPWYRKLFLFPNLAYVMGSLALVFSGFLGYSILRNSTETSNSEVSRIDDAAYSPVNPVFNSEVPSNSNRSIAASNTAASNSADVSTMSSSMNAAANRAVPVAPIQEPEAAERKSKVATDNNFLADGADVAGPPPQKKQAVSERDAASPKPRANPGSMVQELQKSARAADTTRAASLPAASAPAMRAQKAPEQSALSESSAGNAARSRIATRNDSIAAGSRRHVGGRTFEFRQNVWYEAGYRGQPAVSIRRGSDQYKKLDSSLRLIAERLNGTVIVFWKKQAYRIQ